MKAAPTEFAYAETSTVSGELIVNGGLVDDLPMSLSLAVTQSGTTTVQSGQFETVIETRVNNFSQRKFYCSMSATEVYARQGARR